MNYCSCRPSGHSNRMKLFWCKVFGPLDFINHIVFESTLQHKLAVECLQWLIKQCFEFARRWNCLVGDDGCDKKCSQLSCDIVNIEAALIGGRKLSTNETKLVISLSPEPYANITYKQKMSFEEYLAFVGSLGGLYLGLSWFGMFDLLIVVSRKLRC